MALRHLNLYKNLAEAVDFELPLGEHVLYTRVTQLLFYPTMCLVEGSTVTTEYGVIFF